MEYEIHESGETRILSVSGEWTVEHASRLKGVLMDVLNSSDRVVLDLERITAADLSCLQLLCSAHRTSLNAGKNLSLSTMHPEAFKKAAREAGYARTLGCHGDPRGSCLWLGGWES